MTYLINVNTHNVTFSFSFQLLNPNFIPDGRYPFSISLLEKMLHVPGKIRRVIHFGCNSPHSAASPEFLIPVADVACESGDTVTLRCKICSRPRAAIAWRGPDNSARSNNGRYSTTYRQQRELQPLNDLYNRGFMSPSSCVDAVRQRKRLFVLWGCLQRTVACTRVSPQTLQALSRPLPASQSQVGDQ